MHDSESIQQMLTAFIALCFLSKYIACCETRHVVCLLGENKKDDKNCVSRCRCLHRTNTRDKIFDVYKEGISPRPYETKNLVLDKTTSDDTAWNSRLI